MELKLPAACLLIGPHKPGGQEATELLHKEDGFSPAATRALDELGHWFAGEPCEPCQMLWPIEGDKPEFLAARLVKDSNGHSGTHWRLEATALNGTPAAAAAPHLARLLQAASWPEKSWDWSGGQRLVLSLSAPDAKVARELQEFMGREGRLPRMVVGGAESNEAGIFELVVPGVASPPHAASSPPVAEVQTSPSLSAGVTSVEVAPPLALTPSNTQRGLPAMKPIAWAGIGGGALVMMLLVAWLVLHNNDGEEVTRVEVPEGGTVHVVQSLGQNHPVENDEADEPTTLDHDAPAVTPAPAAVTQSTPKPKPKPRPAAAPAAQSASDSSIREKLDAYERSLIDAGITRPGVEAGPDLLVAYLEELRRGASYTGREVASLRVQNRTMGERLGSLRRDLEAAQNSANYSPSTDDTVGDPEKVAAYERALVEMATVGEGVEPGPEWLVRYFEESHRGVSHTAREVIRLRAQNRVMSERIDALRDELSAARKAVGHKQ